VKTVPSRLRGFTLIEVLVSLAIFALAAVMLAAAYVNTLTAYDAAARRNGHEQDLKLVRAALLAETELKKVEEGGEIMLPDERRARWEAKVDPAGVADLFRVTLHCEVSGRDASWTKDFTLMLLRPSWSESDAREKLRTVSRTKLAERKGP
jgi:general secretion pathway protein I